MNKAYSKPTLVICLSIIASVGLACNSFNKNETVSPAQSNDSRSTDKPSAPTSTASTTTTGSREIAGDYTITGTNEGGGGSYGGELKVTKRDEVYQFSWSSGGRTYDGVGVRSDDNVAVAFTEGSDGKGCGVVLYNIASDGSLEGKAGYWGVNKSELEKATRKSGTELEGTYDVVGSAPNGSEYKGKLSVNKAGVGYSFTWDTGTTTKGFGVRTGNKVAAGLGGKQCGFVSYEIKPDGTLDGKWGGQSSTSIGTEIAKKK